MGCICSRESSPIDYVSQNEKEKEKESNKALPVQLVAPSKREEFVVEIVNGNKKPALQANQSSAKEEEQKRKLNFESPKRVHHQRRSTVDLGDNGEQPSISKIASIPGSVEGEQIAAGWPSWLASVAGEAINGWVPRNADSFEKIKKIGQGTYSSVYKARDLDTGKIVAMKKVRFVNMDPESVRFMAREICILRRLDHPNVMKLECLVTSRISGSLYLVFEYMEHDLAGLAASPKMSFSEPQIKCYMQQLFCGLEHCHSRGILHRDIKGSNLLINNDGILKIGDFGLATFFQPDNKQPMTSRVVTLWYRAPELLLGATEYGVAIDLWSTGCILAELFAGKPIMPGRTEVEQMHKIFKLCGSPSAEYWKKTKFPHTTSFKPQNTYRRCVSETFKDFPSSALSLLDTLLVIEPEKRGNAASALNSVFFSTKPLPCVPSSLPKYPPSKEFDAKLRNEEARRRKAEAAKERPSEYFRGDQSKGAPTPEFDAKGEVLLNGQSNKSTSVKYNLQEDSGTGFRMEPPRGQKNEYSHSSSMIHPNAAGYSWPKKSKDDASRGSRLSIGSSGHGADLTRRGSHPSHGGMGSSSSHRKDRNPSTKESMGYAPKRNRILCSGPLMPPGSNLEDMLKEHERQIQEAVRKSRLDKARTKNNCFDYVDPDSLHQRSIHRYN